MLTKEEMKSELLTLKKIMEDLDRVYVTIGELFDTSHGCPAIQPAEDMLSQTIDLLEKMHPKSPSNFWISHFTFDCSFGSNPLNVEDHGVIYLLDSVDSFLEFLYEK